MKNFILMLCVFSIFSCANTKKNNSKENSQTNSKADTTMNYEQLAKHKLNFTNKAEEKFECIKNTAKTFVLCTKTLEGTVMQPRNSIQYVVYDTKTNEMVYEGNIDGGSVKWYDKNRLEIYQQPGMMREGQTQDDIIKIYDLIEKTYTTKSNVENKN